MYNVDDGIGFGLWPDSVSKLIYFDLMKPFFEGVDTKGRVADLGGANGNLKHFIPNSLSVDIDNTKKPDIHADIITHTGRYDLIVIRYVLHYLTSLQQKKLFEHIASYHKGKVLVIQFTNDGAEMDLKIQNSKNETKYFLTTKNLLGLFGGFNVLSHKQHTYTVTKEFYKNRLKINNAIEHLETCHALLLEPAK